MLFEHITPGVSAVIGLATLAGCIVTDLSTEGRKNYALWALLAVLTLVVSYCGLGGYLLFDIDEAIFAEASREMVETGDYLTPTYNYAPRYDKPILIYWFMSIAYKLFGISEFSARFTSAFSGTLLVLFTFGFVRRIRGNLPALFAALALLLNIGYFVYSHAAVTDISLCLLIAVSIYSFYLAIHTGNDRWIYGAWAGAALALLMKGLVGLFLPSVIAILYLLLSRNFREIKRFLGIRYLLLFIVIAGPWYAAEFSAQGWEFFDSFVMKHQVKRYTDGFKGKTGPFYYYLPIVALSFYPWVVFVPAGIVRGIKELIRGSGGLYLLSFIWFVFVFCFFSYAATKHPNYTFPLLPAVAIMAGLGIGECIKLVQERRRVLGIDLMGALSVLFAIAIIAVPFMDVKMTVPLSPWFFFALGGLFLVNGISSLIVYVYAKPLYAFACMAGIMLVTLVFLRITLVSTASTSLQEALYDYGTYVKGLKNVTHVVTYEIHKPSVSFYAERKVQRVTRFDINELIDREKEGTLVIITSDKRYNELKKARELFIVDRRGGYVLISNSSELPAIPW